MMKARLSEPCSAGPRTASPAGPPDVLAAEAPRMTEMKLRFMPLHMM